MGRFSTTLNIKNNSDREGFLKSFCEMMKKRGFVKCNEDEAAVSYALAFGEGWVTLANEDYKDNIKKAYDERKLISEEMKTAAFTVEVVDSDFAILCLNSSGRTSEIVVGDGEGYGVEKAPFEVDDWKPLIKNGDCEKFLDTVGQDNVFAEETLSVTAELLGIDPYYMDADYDDILEKSDDVLYFTKAAEKPLMLKTAFVKVFGEGLEPLGYKRLKKLDNKYPFFVRVVNGDILHVVSYRQTTSPKIGYKEFSVYSGVITLYRRIINFTIEPENILINIFHLYKKSVECGKIDPSVNKPSAQYLCNANDSGEMLRTLQMVFNDTIGVLQNYINKITDLKACVEYFKTYKDMELYPFDEFITARYTSWSEALLLVKTRDMDDSLIRIKKGYDDYDFKRLFGKNAKQEDMDKIIKRDNDEREEQYNLRMEMINNPELNKKVLDEMERCKANNIELLKSYGLFDEPKPQKPAKPLSLNAAFKKVFDAALEPLGFRLIKSKYPYFVRVVPGGEINHVISFRKLQSFDPKYNLIDIVGGVATVYRQSLDLSRSPNNENWFKDNDWIYSHQRPKNSDNNREHYYEFKISTDRQKMLEDMQAACDITCKIMVGMLDKVVNIDACIEFSKELGINLELCDEHYGNDIPGNYYKEGFIYFKTDKNIFRNKMMNAISDIALREKAYFEKVHSDPDLYDGVQRELKWRKQINTLMLKKYGLFDNPNAEKPPTPNAAFKKVFGAALEPLGFRLIKSKHPYYVRVVSDEIIHVISYYNPKHFPDKNNIVIKGGVATVYRQKIDFSRTPRDENWLTNNCDIYICRLRHGLEELDEELKDNLYYHASKPEDILDEMEYQLSLTKRFLLPTLDKAMTIESCIENHFVLHMDLNVYDDGSFGTKYGDGYYNESILYFKTDRSVYENIIKNATSEAALSKEDYFERVQDDPDLYKEVQAELERRKAQNTEILRSYGVDI